MDKKEHKLNILQSIISRMASNSTNCKMWSVTLLAAIIVLFLSTNGDLNVNKIIILIPILPFMFLDAFYLGLERYFVNEYNTEFESKEEKDISAIVKSKGCKRILSTLKAILSFSVWGFYLILCLTIFLVLLLIECK